jgi:hypothetical protein
MVCAKRQLAWKEIQIALSIDVDNQTIEYDDRRFRKHIHEICGSLVSVNGDRVSLVHSTAKSYVNHLTYLMIILTRHPATSHKPRMIFMNLPWNVSSPHYVSSI